MISVNNYIFHKKENHLNYLLMDAVFLKINLRTFSFMIMCLSSVHFHESQTHSSRYFHLRQASPLSFTALCWQAQREAPRDEINHYLSAAWQGVLAKMHIIKLG